MNIALNVESVLACARARRSHPRLAARLGGRGDQDTNTDAATPTVVTWKRLLAVKTSIQSRSRMHRRIRHVLTSAQDEIAVAKLRGGYRLQAIVALKTETTNTTGAA